MCGEPPKVLVRGGEGNLAAATIKEEGASAEIDLNAMDVGPEYTDAPENDLDEAPDYDPSDAEIESRAGDMDLADPLAVVAEVFFINAGNPIVHPKDVWHPGVTTQPRLNAQDCLPARKDCDQTMLMSFYTRPLEDFATGRLEDKDGNAYEAMLSYDLEARKHPLWSMDHIFNCRAAKVNTPA